MNNTTIKKEMTERKFRFCEYYAKTHNATKSAILAGYSEKTAYSQGSRLLKCDNIKKEIEKLSKIEKKKREDFGKIEINPRVMLELEEKFKGNKDDISDFIEQSVKRMLTKEEQDVLKVERKRKASVYFPKSKRYEVLKRAGFKCQSCGQRPDKQNDVVLEIDHIMPRNRGGLNTLGNLQVLCKNCNSSKRDDYIINHNELW